MEAAGHPGRQRAGAPASTLSYDSAARAVANSRADYLFFLARPGANASMAQAMDDTGYKLKFHEYLTAYGSNFIELAGERRRGRHQLDPRRCPTRTAVQRRSSTPSSSGWSGRRRASPPTRFAADAWAASKAFFDAARSPARARSPREALVAQLRSTDRSTPAGSSARSSWAEAQQRLLRRDDGRRRQVEAAHAGPRVPLLTGRLPADTGSARPLAAPRRVARRLRAHRGAARHRHRGAAAAAVTALLGPNGAGKTTALGVMSGLLTPDRRLPPRGGPPPQPRRRRRARPHRHLPHPRGPLGVPEPERGRQPHRRRVVRAADRPRSSRWPSRCSPACRSGATSWPARFPAARSRCSPWPAASAPTRRCSSSTSCRWAWRRWSSASSTTRSPRSRRAGVSVLVVEQFATDRPALRRRTST